MMSDQLEYFDSRYAVHLRVLSARRNVTQGRAEMAAAIVAGKDFERRYGVTVAEAIKASQ
jgi:hypothetical protein